MKRFIQVIFIVKFFGIDGSINMLVYQPILDTLELKDGRTMIMTLKVPFKFELLLLYGSFLPSAKYFGYEIEIQFNNTITHAKL